MEKEITLTDIQAKFLIDTDTFGKMDPLLQFKVGKCQGKTEVAEDGGKEVKWKATIKLIYWEHEKKITVRGLEDDVGSQDDLGTGSIDLATLKESGTLECQLKIKDKDTGTIKCKYSVKKLPPSPVLIVKNIVCEFFKETKFMIKTKPYFSIGSAGKSIVTKTKQQGNSKLLEWKQTLYCKISEKQNIEFNVLDANDSNFKVFGYSAFAKEFRTVSGSKKFNVIGNNFQPLGVVSFDYQTQNFVSKEESQKNQENSKKEEQLISLLNIKKAKGKFIFDGEDIYFKFVLGPNFFKTSYIENAKKQFTKQINKSLYAEHKENKIIVGVYDKDIVNDDILGSGELWLEGLNTGDSNVKINDKDGKHIGDLTLTIEQKKVECRSLIISDISLKIKSGNDIIGSSEPYVIGKIGGWTARTETTEGEEVKFARNLQLKFSNQKQLALQVWEEDLNNDDCLYRENVPIQSFKAQGGQMEIPFKNENDGKSKEGYIKFKYTVKGTKKPEPPKQQQQKKQEKVVPNTNPVVKQVQKKVQKVQKVEEKVELQKKEPTKPVTQNISQVKQPSRHDKSIDYSSLERSKNTFKLPSIGDQKNFGDKIFDKQSSATLQNSIHVYTMPKSNRFTHGPKYAGEPSYYVDTAFKPNSGKGAGFGFGNKRQFPEWMQKNMKQNPAPGSYDKQHNVSTDFRPKGPTFGIAHKYYQKVTIPKEKKAMRSFERLKPINDK